MEITIELHERTAVLLDLLLQHHDALPLLGREDSDLVIRQLQDLHYQLSLLRVLSCNVVQWSARTGSHVGRTASTSWAAPCHAAASIHPAASHVASVSRIS